MNAHANISISLSRKIRVLLYNRAISHIINIDIDFETREVVLAGDGVNLFNI